MHIFQYQFCFDCNHLYILIKNILCTFKKSKITGNYFTRVGTSNCELQWVLICRWKTQKFEGSQLSVCLFEVNRPTPEFFSHTCLETSLLPVKGFKLWPLLGTHDLWARKSWRGFLSLPHLMCQETSVYMAISLTPVAKGLAVELSLPIRTTLVCHDWGSNLGLPHATDRTCRLGASVDGWVFFIESLVRGRFSWSAIRKWGR